MDQVHRDNNLDNDTFACFCYIPPKDSTAMCNYESQWNSFMSEVIEFSTKGSILICGDMNARTGTLCDYVRNDYDIPFPLLYLMSLMKMNSNAHPRTCQLLYRAEIFLTCVSAIG